MDRYRWALKDGSKAEVSFSPHLDNLIRKYRNNVVVESVFLMDCGIVSYMPCIMRYCFEEDVNLRKRPFLRDLGYTDFCEIDKVQVKQDFQRPLMDDGGLVRHLSGDLVICSSPLELKGKISFNKEDVPEFVEGILRVLDNKGIILARRKCSQIVQYYSQCLDKGILQYTKK